MKFEIEDTDLDLIANKVLERLKPLLRSSLSVQGNGDNTIFDKKGLANYLKVKTRWVDDHIKLIPHFKVGRFPRFRKKEIDKWIETQNVPIADTIFISLAK